MFQRLIQTRVGKFFKLEHPDLEKPRDLTPIEKFALDRKDKELTLKADWRSTICWAWGCNRPPTDFVREVGFDFKGDKAAALDHITISSADYPGPVPGFCIPHTYSGEPMQLVEKVYWDRPEIQWGAKPTRWWLVFTNGIKLGGSCLEIDPLQLAPDVKL